jgi:hypothetical protein
MKNLVSNRYAKKEEKPDAYRMLNLDTPYYKYDCDFNIESSFILNKNVLK